MLDVCPDCGSKMKINSTKPEKDCTTVYFKCRACVVTHPAIMMRAEHLRTLRVELKSLRATAHALERQLAGVKAANATFVANSLSEQASKPDERTHAAPPSYTEPTLYERRAAFQETYGVGFNEGMFMQTAIQNGWAEPIAPSHPDKPQGCTGTGLYDCTCDVCQPGCYDDYEG